MMEEQVQDHQSALRCRGADSSIGSNILADISFRKKLKKNLLKALRALKRLECSNNGAFPLFDVDCHLSMVVKALRESKAITIFMEKPFNAAGIVDFTLYTLHGQVPKNDAKIDAQTELRRLETLSASVKGLEAGLDCLFRCLIRNRVSLLNILTP
ncbi:uncharacterized protein LOC111316487 [Durio zibethinus]|uniref:Uncharacterized protein LOC111316487 n=1 Tax=Durio zibethinus TaxID=66656 RepID=A0A6P6BAN4_DURZI|nr:uncharacterized protein LOC111316487 [Durio zibethinus]